ncbi:CDPF1 protein, partial [Chaetorhynchus papuensis]|nr:CDPF1 protein [Chaetorhynchus papuensis]
MDAPKEVQTPGEFKCELWELSAPYTYYGQMPPNSHLIVLLEEAYIMKDPFTPDRISSSSLGLIAVCVAEQCVLFYSKRFHLPCVKEKLKAFPLEIQEDVDKRKPQQKSCKKNGYEA